MKYIELAYAWIICLTVDKRRSILIEHSFNSWKWPFMYFGSYYNSIPNYDKNKSIDTKYYVFRKIMDYLRSRSNQFERLRYHNVEAIMSMTEDEFIIWFEEHSIFR